MKIAPPPTVKVSSPERKMLCEEALTKAWTELLDLALAAGWGEEEAVETLLQIAVGRTLTVYDRETDGKAAAAIRRIRGCNA